MIRLKSFKTKLNDFDVTVEVHSFGRRGTRAQASYYYLHEGRWVSAYERRVRGWKEWSLQDLVKINLFDKLIDLIPSTNPFLDLIDKKKDLWQGVYYKPPIHLEGEKHETPGLIWRD